MNRQLHAFPNPETLDPDPILRIRAHAMLRLGYGIPRPALVVIPRPVRLFAHATRSLLVLSVVAFAACGVGGGRDSSADAWRAAQGMWQRRELGAYQAWRSIDPASREGREARARLTRADEAYRDGVRRLEGDGRGAREALARGVSIAPMDPRLYARLGRACQARGLDARAAEYFTKYLAALPEGAQAAEVRGALEQLDPELAGVFQPSRAARRPASTEDSGPSEFGLLGLGALFGLLLAFTLAAARRFYLGRGTSLSRLAEARPELHPAITYLVGSLRHELLKHRLGAAGDALAAVSAGGASEAQLDFLRTRLFGGEGLVDAWRGHVEAFERGLGEFELGRDALFRSADRAIRRIARLEPRLASPTESDVARLRRAHRALGAFDHELSKLTRRLIRTEVDDALLAEVVEQVTSEYAAGRVSLDALEVVPLPEPVELEVFRVDLTLILKNVLRNALFAVDRVDGERRVRLEVEVLLEPTGEETVAFRVSDTSAAALNRDALFDRRADRGLGLVGTAVRRYGGAIDVTSASSPYQKAVVVSFFRALDEEVD